MIFPVLLFLLLSFNSECVADITFSPHEQKVYLPGDFIQGTLKFESNLAGEISQLKGKKFVGNFYVSNLGEVENSQVDITLIPIKYIDTQAPLNWLGVQVNLSSLSLGQPNFEPKSFIILKQTVDWPFFENPMLWVLSLIFLMGLAFYLWKRHKNKMFLKEQKLIREKLILKWRDLLKCASKREDFESIFNKRKEWIPLINPNQSNLDKFFEILDKHQYKKEWNSSDLEEIRQSYSRFKDGI